MKSDSKGTRSDDYLNNKADSERRGKEESTRLVKRYEPLDPLNVEFYFTAVIEWTFRANSEPLEKTSK